MYAVSEAMGRDLLRAGMLVAALVLSVDVVQDLSGGAVASGVVEVLLVGLAVGFMYRNRQCASQEKAAKASEMKGAAVGGAARNSARSHLAEHFAKHAPAPRASRKPMVQHTFVKSRVFVTNDLVDQVRELLEQLEPTSRCYDIMEKVRSRVLHEILPHCPGVDVRAYLHSDITESTAYASAVPEMELAVFVDAVGLASWVLPKGEGAWAQQPEKVSKHLLRHLTKALVYRCYADGLRHCRSFYCAAERRLQVTLALMHTDEFNHKVAFDFSVNWHLPTQHDAMIGACAQRDPGALGLVRIVRRWSKDRGICFAPHGHLGPYAWTTLVVFFLQVHQGRLSRVRFHKTAEGACQVTQAPDLHEDRGMPAEDGSKTALARDVCHLFKEFVLFYAEDFRFSVEGVDLRHEQRRLRSEGDGFSHFATSPLLIVDPFDSRRNLGANVTEVGLARLEAEFARARDIFSSGGAKLSKILELWVGIGTTRESRDEQTRDGWRSAVGWKPER